MPNCQICPVSHECEEAKRYMDLIHHEEFNGCVLLRNLQRIMDNYISVVLSDPRGYRPDTPDIGKRESAALGTSTHLHIERT
jgi:hypothetical protein